MRARVLRAAVLAGLLPAAAAAQGVSLTEAEALARLSPDSPHVLAAGRWPNPRATYNRESVAGIAEDMFMVSQVLPVTGRRGFEVQAANARVDAFTSRADNQVRRLRADLRLAFAHVWAAQTR